MIRVIGNDTNRVLFELIKNSKKEIYLCAPFIKKDIVSRILKEKDDNVKLTVITVSNMAHFLCGSLDISAVKHLMEKGTKVYNYPFLHAKIYLFDETDAIVTSANLTNAALYKNYEYGVRIKKNKKQLQKLI